MKNNLVLIASVLLLLLCGCKKESSEVILEPKKINLTTKASEVIYKSNGFGIELFKQVASDDEGNMMLSPLSASTALTMLLNGCDNDTYKQIQIMLDLDSMTISEINNTYKSLAEQLLNADSKVKLALANSVWYKKGFEVKTPFLDIMKSDFAAHAEALDFNLPSALTTMNNWANDNTYGKIPKVLDEISPDAVMFLMNALYFKGSWTYQFDKSKTNQSNFYLKNGNSISVETMHGSPSARVIETNDYKAIELTYGRANYSMVIVVPNENLSNYLSSLDKIKWGNISQSLDAIESPSTYEVSLPKFSFKYEKVLNNQLKSMGMIDAFSEELADLSKISDADIFVNFVKQNTFVEVSEEGTEAAAVTVVGINVTSISEPNTFTVDKPFVFAIRERTTNTLLFIGQVVDPTR